MSQPPESTSSVPERVPDEDRRRKIIDAARQQAEQPSRAETKTHFGQDSDTGSGRLEIRCPSCHAPMEVAVDTTLTDLTCSACGSHFSLVDQSQATRMAPPLSKLGRFELVERIGVGGFGSVWKARDKGLDRTVAIKIPRQGAMSAEEQEKFFREARAAAQLRHPNIVSVHEVGRDGDSVYIVSDFVRGVTLGDWLTGQQLTSREAADLCARIADALEHAHEQGVVHRDLKPANIMIDGDGEPHLMDFGLARRDVGEITVTIDGQVLGTPAYMSPEQAAGESHTADGRSDVYSLGVILFQLLTGERPFRGNARMLVHQVINDPPPSPRKLNSNVSKDLETIALKCLEKDPARRYQSAKDLASDLRRFLAGQPIHARPVSRVERGWRWCHRNPMTSTLAAALLAIVLTIAVVAPGIAFRQAVLRSHAEFAQASEAKLRIKAEADEKKAKTEAERSKQVAKFLTEMLNGVGPSVALGRDTTLLREILDKTADRLGTDLNDQPEVEADLRYTIGDVEYELREYHHAEAMYREALALDWNCLGREDPSTRKNRLGDNHPHLAERLLNLASLVQSEGKTTDSEPLLRGAIVIYNAIVRDNPNDTKAEYAVEDCWRDIARTYGAECDWQKAAKAIANLKELDPDDPYAYYYLAAADLAADDLSGYRAVCDEMLARLGTTTNSLVANRIGYACVPAPHAVNDLSSLVAAAKLAVPVWQGNDRLLGAALYRAGKYNEALEQFNESARKGHAFRAWDCAFLAMIQHRLGNTAEATRRLDEARQKKDAGEGWWEKVEVDHLIREADDLISGKESDSASPR